MTADDSEARRAAAFTACDRFLGRTARPSLQAELTELANAVSPQERPDHYGSGAVVEAVEEEVAHILGKEAALLFPTGTMAQQVALRTWADRRRSNIVAFHPTCHLERYEHKAYQVVHGLEARLIGDASRCVTRADLEHVSGEVAALLLELPQREIGGQLPPWDDLQAQVERARSRGVALHLDGARLWESAPFYGKSYAEIAALFDSVYVSFYKTLDALAGAALTGTADFIAEARIWRRRHGGDLFQFAPLAVSMRLRLHNRLPLIPALCAEAQRIAAVLRQVPGVLVKPDPPHTNMMHVYLRGDAETLIDRAARIAEQDRVQLFRGVRPADVPGWSVLELAVEDARSALSDDEIRTYFTRLTAMA